MKNKVNYFFIFFIVLLLSIRVLLLSIRFSYGFSYDDIKKDDLLIGNDVYSGYVSPNKIIRSSIDYYKKSNDYDGLKIFKYDGNELTKYNWQVLSLNNNYSKLSSDELNKLEIRRYVNTVNTVLSNLSENELIEKSVLNDNGNYYFFTYDLEKMNINSIKDIYGYVIYSTGKIIDYRLNLDGKYYEDLFGDVEGLKIVNVSDYGQKLMME